MTRALGMLLAATLLGGCALRADERLRFAEPPDRARAIGPVNVRWTFEGPAPARYGVFVDRPPMRPGRDVDSLADRDPLCRRVATCPDEDWLADHGVYITAEPALTLRALPVQGGRQVPGGLRRHELTVVLLDARGTRQGEGAWTRVLYDRDRREGR